MRSSFKSSSISLSSIRRSERVSDDWKRALLATPTLYQDVDLSSLSEKEDLERILRHLKHYSSRSRDKLVDVSLNINPFFFEGDVNFAPVGKSVMETLLKSKETLKIISIQMLVVFEGFEGRPDTLDFFVKFTDLFLNNKFPNLKRVFLTCNSIHNYAYAGEHCQSSKSFAIIRNNQWRYEEGFPKHRLSLVRDLIDRAIDFVGSGLTIFQAWPVREDQEIAFPHIINELKRSRSTLVEVSIRLLGIPSHKIERLLSAIKDCKSLTSLSLEVSGGSKETREKLIRLPENAIACSNLLELEIESNLNLDWNSWTDWFGHSLEVIDLSLLHPQRSHLPAQAPSRLLLNSSETLTKISLGLLEAEDDEIFSSYSSCNFPNLEVLVLQSAPPSFFKFFSNLNSPKLRSLVVNSHGPSSDAAVKCLVDLVQRYCLRLKLLSVGTINQEVNFQSSGSELEFPKLEVLIIRYDCHTDLKNHLSHLQYPSLETLDLGELVGKMRKGKQDLEKLRAQFSVNAPKLKELDPKSI